MQALITHSRFDREQALLDAMSENAVLLDSNGTILLANNAWKIFARENGGDEKSCGISKNYLEMCNDGSEESVVIKAGLLSILEGKKEKFQYLYPCHSPTHNRWFIVTITLFCSEKNGALLTHNNVTHLIEHQLSIEAREKRYATIINSMVEGLVIQDKNGEIESCNDAAEALLGLSKRAMNEQRQILPVSKLLRLDGSKYEKDDHPNLLSLNSEESIRDLVVGIEREEGETDWIKINSHPIYDNPYSEKATSVVTTLFSVTEELRHNRELKELSDRLELAAASASIGIWDWNIQDDKLIWDRQMCLLYGLDSSSFEGSYGDWIEFIHPDNAADIAGHIKDAVKNNTPFEKDFKILWPDNSIRIIKPYAVIRRDNFGVAQRMVGTNQDVTDLRLAQSALQEREHRLQLLIHNLPVGAVYLEKNKVHMNTSATNITGYGEEEISSVETWFDVLFSEKSREVFQQYQRDRTRDFPSTRTLQFKHKDNSHRWMEFDGFLFEKSEAWIITDITNRVEAEKKLERLAFYDTLTDLPNRAYFDTVLHHAVSRAKRHNLSFALLLLDVDQFKRVNDTYGHPIGDKLLVLFSQRLKLRIRESDTVARIGGDEFVVMVEDMEDPNEVKYLAKHLIKELRNPYQIDTGFEISSSVSIGISIFPTHAIDTVHLLRNADTAMYQAKSKGRNTYRVYSENLTSIVEQRMSIEIRLRQAIEQNNFVVHYQPQIDIKTGQICGAEALIRWQEQGINIYSPSKFIAVAEDTGLINILGEKVLLTACEDMARWIEEGLSVGKISVNLSPVQFESHNVLKLVSETLALTNLDPKYLVLEITENTLVTEVNKTDTVINDLQKIGVGFNIDDFGTGYSSLAYLKRFSVNGIKIDQSFIQDIPEDKNDSQLVKTIIDMGHNLNLSVLAEGVENEAQLNFLKDSDCDSFQGFLFSAPLSACDFRDMVCDKSAQHRLKFKY